MYEENKNEVRLFQEVMVAMEKGYERVKGQNHSVPHDIIKAVTKELMEVVKRREERWRNL